MATWFGAARDPVDYAGEPTGTIPAPPLGPEPFLMPETISGDTLTFVDNGSPVIVTEHLGEVVERSAGTYDFWEDFHVVPRAFDFGNLLSDQSIAIEVFSAFRRETHTWIGFVNGAGAGVDLVGEPTLPTEVPPLTGFQMTLDVSATGDPFVDDVLTFIFDIGLIEVPIEIQRIVLWGIAPELPFREILGFLTDVIPKRDGSEQRIALRKNPRQRFMYPYLVDEGTVRQTLENLLFDWQSRVFAVPVWLEETELTAAATAGDTSIAVTETDWRDFRVGGLVVIFTGQSTFDAIVITSIGPASIGLDSPLINSYPVGTRVYPLSTCTVRTSIPGGRFPVNLARLEIEFTNTDNDANLADVSAFATFNGKVLLDNGNSISSDVVPETFTQPLVELDGLTGVREILSPQDRHRRGYTFILRAKGLQAIWEMRQLLHALRGRQVSFYVPRGSDDLTVVANLLNAGNTMDVTNVGYTQFVRSRQPKNVIAITLTNGTVLMRTITDSVVTSPTVETLEVDTNWPSTITPAQIERVEYVEKVRLDDDDVEIEYEPGHLAHMVAPVMVVLE